MATPAVSPTKKYTKGQLAEKLMPQLRCIEREDFRSWLTGAPDRYEYLHVVETLVQRGPKREVRVLLEDAS